MSVSKLSCIICAHNEAPRIAEVLYVGLHSASRLLSPSSKGCSEGAGRAPGTNRKIGRETDQQNIEIPPYFIIDCGMPCRPLSYSLQAPTRM